MFKIESYITPIIINYIDKYVKDFRPQNAQVSLWGGEVAFQNLDIRLDVLQQELHLPLNIVSGHIHELTIRVPWTKIASEPIQINVNTIEFVVKLKSDNGEKKEKDVETLSQSQIIQEPPGYMASLINKIANNISIKLNNIIFKYIEDDIVLSMNVQMLSIDSADDIWNPAFIDINPVKVALKKVINVNDLTICLDKRNAQGKIDVCQEPILYRCSLQARMIRKYNLATAHLASITRIDIFTDNIDFKISVQQFPILIRLYLLVQMLREVHTNLYGSGRPGREPSLGGNADVDAMDSSYSTWIWNMLPEIFPQSVEDEHRSLEMHGHIFHNGFYARNVNITLKSQEIVSSSIIQTNTTYKYHPFLKICLSGVSFDAVSVGKIWNNFKGGISYIGIFPMGNCTCGKKHNLPTIFLSGRKIKGENESFLLESLKDPNCCENKNQNRVYESDFQSHMMLHTEAEMLSKSPALAIDVVNHRQVLDDTKTYGSHSISSRDFDTITEEYFVRIMFGDFNFKIDTTLMHLHETLNDHYKQYTYIAPYLVVNTPDVLSQLTPPSTDDYESLLDCIPLRKYNFYLNKANIEFYHLNADHMQVADSNDFKTMPFFMLHLSRAEMSMVSPLYPEKLINTTCQLPDPSEKLKENCYIRMNATLNSLTMDVIFNKHRLKALSLSQTKISYDTLIQPELWKIIKIENYTFELTNAELKVAFNKLQLMLFIQLMESFTPNDKSISSKTLKPFQSVDLTDSNLPCLELVLNRVKLSLVGVDNIIGAKLNLASIKGFAFLPRKRTNDAQPDDVCKTIFLSNENFDSDLLNLTVQYPVNINTMNHPPIVNFVFQKTILNFDLLLQEFLNFNILLEHGTDILLNSEEKTQKRVRKSSKMSKPMLRTESVHSNSVTTLSIVNIATKVKDQDKQQLIKWYDIIKRIIVYINVKSLTVVCPHQSLFVHQADSTLNAMISNAKNISFTSFRLPCLEIQTSKFKNIQSCLKTSFPINLSENWPRTATGFPWNIELKDFTCDTFANDVIRVFLPTVNTKLTLDLTSKLKEGELNGEEMSFVIHLDTTPIALNLDSSQIKQIYDSILMMTKCRRKPEQKAFNPLLEAPPTIYDAQINDFICETTNSEKSSEEVIPDNADKTNSKINCLIQWTITKFTLTLVAPREIGKLEFLLELEDIITSVDKQSAYMKVKTKIGSVNGVRKKTNRITGNVDVLTIISRSDTLIVDTQETFFEMVATTAIASNVHNRWGATTKKVLGFRDDTDTITEIMITMQSIDFKLELDVLNVILIISNEVHCEQTIEENHMERGINVAQSAYSVKDLPLLFFNCKGLQMWLPNMSETNPNASDVLIVKVNAISITPSVDNPIQRKPVREDIYVKAAQLRMINTPGSIIEDRQYELLFKNVSIVTGNWNEILNFSYPANNENPAFDWNNQTEKPSLNVNTVFNDFIVSVIYAPAIIFHNIIVCGPALELNSVNDLLVNLTLNDIDLINNLRLDVLKVLRQKINERSLSQRHLACVMRDDSIETQYTKSTRKESSHRFATSSDQNDRYFSDSGFKSNFNQEKPKSSENAIARKTEIPFAYSFVGGLFTFQVYKNSNCNNAPLEQNVPLVAIRMKQPNLFATQESTEIVQQMSIYNLSVNLFDQTIFEQTSNEFGDNVFDTHQGELDDTGISPALFELKIIRSQANADTKIQCNIRKPIQVQFTPNNVEKLFSLKRSIDEILNGDAKQTPVDDLRPIIRYNKIKEIKKLIGDASSVELNITKLTVNFMTSMNCLLSVALFKWSSKIAAQHHPEQLSFSTNLNSFEINTESSMILHPTTIAFDCTLAQEKWNKRLLISSNFVSNVIDFQISSNDILTFAKIQVDFLACINRHCKLADGGVRIEKNAEQIAKLRLRFDRKNLKCYALPAQLQFTGDHCDEEYFQDDLRLGTFEYITVEADNVLPLPYQIFLLDNKTDMQICWRYPHPRTIHFVQIYPIPGQDALNIKCRLEYFQESHNTFFPYVFFNIGDKKTSKIELPKRKLTASVWRIVLFDPVAALIDLDPDELDTINDILNPRTMIGCIRIDSVFSIKNVPIVQANVKINKLSFSILNNVFIQKYQVPDLLQQYSLKVEEHVNNTQEFCEINFGNINANINLYDDMQTKVYNEFGFGVNIFDSTYLSMVPLIDYISIRSYIETNFDNRPNILNVTADKLSIRYGPPVGCAIVIAEQVWQNILKDIESKNCLPIMTRYVVCNSTSVSLKFGQDETDEAIWLQSNECFYYAFRTEKSLQKLKFSVKSGDSIVEVIESFPLSDVDELKYLKVADDKLLLISSRKVSTTQKQIIIKGQIELMNMSKESFQIHYKMKNVKSDADAVATSSNQCVILLPATSNGSFFETCDDSCNAFIRLQLASGDANGWSGEIPLKKENTNIPWLVKIPSKSIQKFVTYSVRIHSEYCDGTGPINCRPKRILIVIWPFFVARSLLPMHLKVDHMEFDKSYLLQGKGSCTDLQIAGTFDTEHELLFDLGPQNEDNCKTILTYKNIDKKTFFAIPEQFKCIDDMVKELTKPEKIKWPCSMEEELSIDRKVAMQYPTAPLYKFSASRSLSCSMQLDVIPWCLIINNLGCEIIVTNLTDKKSCSIQSNNMAIPMAIANAFSINLKCDDDWITSRLITLSENKVNRSQLSVHLPEEGTIATEISTNTKLIKLCVTSLSENGTRIISISPLYIICNFSAFALSYHSFCINRNEKTKYDTVAQQINAGLKLNQIPNNCTDASNPFKGCECSIFSDISQKTTKSTTNLKDFNFFVVIGCDSESLSAPILLNKPIVRTAFGIRFKGQNISLAASITQHKDQFFVSIYEDRYPFIEIENQTSIEIFVAEADFVDFSKTLKPKKSIHDENFQWYCSVLAYSSNNYTPPSINERFPEKQNTNAHLIFGCGNSKLMPDGHIQWSIPVETNKSDEKYLALPLYGDIKMTSSNANKTVKILLQHIDFKKEFNVKVVHTKLSSPDEHSSLAQGSDEITTIEDFQNESQQSSRMCCAIKTTRKPTLNIFNTDIFVKEINLTLYDEDKSNLHKKNDIASVFLDDVIVCYSEEKRGLEFGFGNIQIDNHLYASGKFDFPVILCGQNNVKIQKHTANSKLAIESTDQTTTNASKYDSSAVNCDNFMPTPFSLPLMKEILFKNQLGYIKIIMEVSVFSPREIYCSVEPLRVYVEDKFIAVLLDFGIENFPSNIIYTSNSNRVTKRSTCERGEILLPRIVAEEILSFLLEPLRLEHICIKPLSVLLSVHTCMRMYIALDHSPLHFAQFESKNIYTTTMRLGYNIGMHYVSDAIFGAGWVVGSLEILGSPSGLARSVSTGLWDFVSMPVQGLMRGPWGVLLGITYGSASLIKNITAGTVNSVTKLAASVARNLDRLTLDDEHLERTEALRRARPMGITHGLSQGLTGFGINLLGAVGGIARHALEAKSSVQVFTGLGKGLLGVVTKPISGAAELLALTGQGVLHTVGFNTMPTSRSVKYVSDRTLPMSITKVAWKILSKIDYHDRVLTVASAALVDTAEKMEDVTVAITTKLILVISDESNELAKVLTISRTRATIDSKNTTNLILTVKSDDESQQYNQKRILQYLSKAYIQSSDSRPNFDEGIQSGTTNETNKNVLVCKEPDTALFLSKYIQFLYFCLNTSK